MAVKSCQNFIGTNLYDRFATIPSTAVFERVNVNEMKPILDVERESIDPWALAACPHEAKSSGVRGHGTGTHRLAAGI